MKYLLVAAVQLVAALLSAQVVAQNLPAVEITVLAGLSTRDAYRDVELPFWSKTIPAHSDGRIMVEVKGFDERGLKGPDVLRLMKQGVVEFGAVPLSYFVDDLPASEAIDIAGLAPDAKTARAMANAFLPALGKVYSANFQVRLLGISPYSPQLLFCNSRVSSLSDLKGKKVRTVTRTQGELIDALGAQSISVPFGDVPAAFDKKKIDCAIAGAMAAYKAKWYEAATHLMALPLGWNQEIHAVGQKAWSQIDPEVQDFLITNIDQLIDSLWSYAITQNQLAIDCLSGAKACTLPAKGKMVLVRPTQTDLATLRQVASQKVLPKWAARCSTQCVTDFNQTVGKIAGLTARKK